MAQRHFMPNRFKTLPKDEEEGEQPMNQCPIRHDITTPPHWMSKLPIDKRGYPVPWFVQWINGEPEFRVMDMKKFRLAINNELCWTCGQPMFSENVFVIGPMCAVNLISAEPPNHRECALYSAQNCPFLTRPHMHRRKDEALEAAKGKPAGIMIERNPGITLLWYTRRYNLINGGGQHPKAGPGILFELGRAFKTEWYKEGRPATRAEVTESIDSGIPTLRELEKENGSQESSMLLEMQITRAMRLIPRGV
jgi:hypothetical protein